MNHITTISCHSSYKLDDIRTLILEEGGEYDINKSKVILNINDGILIIYKENNNTVVIERNNNLNTKMITILNRIINILKRDILAYYTEKFSIETCDLFYNNK